MAAYPIPAHLSPQAAQGWGNQYASGARLGLAQAQLVQQAIRQAQAMRQAQAELEQRARQFEAQQEARHQAELRRQQELEIESAHKEILLGLRERELENRARTESRRISDAANRSAAMLKISQQNADTQRMRAQSLGRQPLPSELSSYTGQSGRRFEKVFNPNTGGITLHPSEVGAGPTITKRTEFPEIPEIAGQPAKPALYIPGLGIKVRSATPAVPGTPGRQAYTETERRRLPATPAPATATNAPPLPRFKWVNGALEPVKASGKEDELIGEDVVEEDEEMALADEEE